MSQLDKVTTKTFNHFVEEGDGNLNKAHSLFAAWVEENSPRMVSQKSYPSWQAIVVGVKRCFQDAGYSP